MDETYGAHYATLYRNHWWWRAREEFLERELTRRLGRAPEGEVLDFGCGDGLFFPVLKRFGAPSGIEPEEKLLDPKGPWRARISTAPLALDGSQAERYRLIVALDVLEHIEDPRPVVAELGRRLRPGGWFVATVPAFQSLWTAHDDLNHHVRRYRKCELEALMREAGLEVVQSRYFFTWLAVVKWFVARAERLLSTKPKTPDVPWAPINTGVLELSRMEHGLFDRHPLPFGSSLLVIARAPG